MPIKPIQNTNNIASNKTFEFSPSLQKRLNTVEVKAVAAPTPVIAGAPIQTQEKDSVEISKEKEDKKFDWTILLALLAGVGVSGLVSFVLKKVLKH